jgi:hypothetical protein
MSYKGIKTWTAANGTRFALEPHPTTGDRGEWRLLEEKTDCAGRPYWSHRASDITEANPIVAELVRRLLAKPTAADE